MCFRDPLILYSEGETDRKRRFEDSRYETNMVMEVCTLLRADSEIKHPQTMQNHGRWNMVMDASQSKKQKIVLCQTQNALYR